MLISNTSKVYEKPPTGVYIGVLADAVDLGIVQGKFGPKPMVCLVWVLNAKDKEGNYYRAMAQVNASLNEKSKLYDLIKGILGTAPPVPYESENLIGKQNQLVVALEQDAQGKPFSNIKAILPFPAGTQPFPVPADFVRNKDRQKGQTIAQAQPATTQPTTQPAAEKSDVEF